ncbi:MAG: tRNA threonylcarbamoyladenosine dehydratase [Spirochaetes bacterium]|nr:tRNA threonylcarbamoyladenosine dehydratase [Spirochaetota bacterium]
MERFLRTELLLGKDKFLSLRKKTVTVVGLGAVGSFAIEGLSRSGIQNFVLVDFDIIHKTNINRQIYALESTLEEKKVDVAVKRILDINPQAQVIPLPIFAHHDSFEQIFQTQTDLVIDAIDSVNPKASLLAEVWHRKIPVLSSMGAALRTDPSYIHVGDLMKTTGCPLARMMRKRLKKKKVGKGITAVYSTEKIDFEFSENNGTSDEYYQRGRQRQALGSLPTITGIFGLTIANLAIKKLLEE